MGKDLSKSDLDLINRHRKREFKAKIGIHPAPDNDDWTTPYFLVRNRDGRLLAFARLHHLKVNFRGRDYPVLGIATILSIEKRKGHGRKLLEAMKRYSQDRNTTAIGFCDPEDTPFYEKCGLGVIKGMDTFIFPSGPKSSEPGDIVYIESGDGLIKEMREHPHEKVRSYSEEW